MGLIDLILGYHDLNKQKLPLKESFGILQLLQHAKDTFVEYWGVICGTRQPEK